MKIFLAALISNYSLICPKNSITKNNKDRILQESLLYYGIPKKNFKNINILESFYYLRNKDKLMTHISHFGSFLLDSGAFTFLSRNYKETIDWDRYIEEYADFINRYKVEHFFELDIDSIVGIKEVERLREKLENLTERKSIPVWHKNRGKEYFIEMCNRYPYVALGGIAIKEISKKKYEEVFPWFIKTAHEHNCKIHGLGYTNIANLYKYKFDSVDSTSWLYGNIGGYLSKFNPRTGLIEQLRKNGYRLKTREGVANNLKEWVKFCMYAENFL